MEGTFKETVFLKNIKTHLTDFLPEELKPFWDWELKYRYFQRCPNEVRIYQEPVQKYWEGKSESSNWTWKKWTYHLLSQSPWNLVISLEFDIFLSVQTSLRTAVARFIEIASPPCCPLAEAQRSLYWLQVKPLSSPAQLRIHHGSVQPTVAIGLPTGLHFMTSANSECPPHCRCSSGCWGYKQSLSSWIFTFKCGERRQFSSIFPLLTYSWLQCHVSFRSTAVFQVCAHTFSYSFWGETAEWIYSTANIDYGCYGKD